MKNWRLIIGCCVLGLFSLSSCSEEFSDRMNPAPQALGLANSITVIADENLWNSSFRDSFEYYFKAAYPILPQPEPIFDIRHFSPKELNENSLRKELRTYIILSDLSDQGSEATQMTIKDLGTEKSNRAQKDTDYNSAVGYNRWAKGQMVIYLFGKNRDDLFVQVAKQFPAIARKVNKFDEEKLYSTVYLEKSNSKLNTLFKDNFNATLDIPADYFLAIHEDKTMWFRKETDFISSNIMVTEVPYSSKEQLTKAGMKRTLDSLGIKYISTELEGTFKKINDVDLPMLAESTNLGNSFALESRGIWEIENDFMGGPFLSYAVLSPDKKKIMYLEGFVHAPGKEKRKYMQYLEVILQSFKFDTTQ